MKQGWEIKKLGEVCKISPPKSEIKAMNLKDETLVSFLPMEDLGINQMYIRPHNSRSLSEVGGGYTYFAKNDILLAKVTPCFENGKLGIAKDLCSNIGFGSSEYIVIRADESNVKFEYIYYGLMTDAFRKNGARLMLGASGLKRLPKDYVANYELGIPSELSEQERIVGILDSAFAKIEALRANAQQNLQNTKDLFQASIDKAYAIPAESRPISSVAKVINGYAFSSNDFKPTNSVKSIKITNVGVGEFIEESDNYLPAEYADRLQDAQVSSGDIVIALTRTIISAGLKVAVVPNSYNKALVNQRVAALVPFDGIMSQKYLYNFLLTTKVKNYVLEHVNTLMQPNLSITDLKNMDVPYLSYEEQKVVASKIDALSERCRAMEENYRQTIAHCNALKQALLTKAFNGEL